MFWFAFASLSPVVTLGLAAQWGGGWSFLALLHMTVFVVLMDRLTSRPLPSEGDNAGTARLLSVALGIAHFAVLIGAVQALTSAELTLGSKIGLAAAAGLFLGQVSNSNAHELIHRAGRFERALGTAVYVSLLFGHHVSAHRRVHHVHVATDQDPNSARRGQGFYRFWPRAWVGSFLAGYEAETVARQGRGGHPYRVYVGGALFCLALAALLWGHKGVLIWVGLAGFAQTQLLLADYIQHYGLRRVQRPGGRLEPAGPAHSWNAPQWYSGAMMLNAPRHSDHHMHPGRIFATLELQEDMPTWPHAMPVMAVLALVPPLWRRIMDPRVDQWSAGRGKS
ncbi:alkane 1-monooxygenase [Falsiruegeria mediterranea]|uniref:Alkane 1-monooxygenase 2 n=1 Tax=Falsiruegeria mediterranea M17 TaxID=1200281 RepID=A0A2R8C4X9_9RHOB|nr:alkane 1-monooxygenase [Falsiruegeria mediterranea]SPJ27490.1 Alkane 1-monooxygenase 2 [Falsiruegeria mediterranea M17]